MPSVVLVLIDGLRPDAISAARCPNLETLRRSGAWTMNAQSVMPSITLPCHMSIFHSVPPSQHRVTSNDNWPIPPSVPGIVEIAHQSAFRCAFFYNWEPLRNLAQPESLFLSYYRNNCKTTNGDNLNAWEAARFIRQAVPDFSFVYFGCVDETGHSHGWMSDEYLAQVERADHALGTVLDSLPHNTSVLVQSDHGGHDHDHGTDLPEDMTIPWILVGPSIRQSYEITEPVSLLDTAPTLAQLLGVAPHPEWHGHFIEAAFEDSYTPA
jgi:predicted AlkP superfamily pyrophosphatase or phosphodiesterase